MEKANNAGSTRLTIICAWCGCTMQQGFGVRAEDVTHGVCETCHANLRMQTAALRKERRAAA